MILVDSSVWIQAWRGNSPALQEALSDLIERHEASINLLIQTEILQGAQDYSQQKKLKKLLEPIPVFNFPQNFWEEAPVFYLSLRKKGLTLSTMDSLIACHCKLENLSLWSLDKVFIKIPQLKLFSSES